MVNIDLNIDLDLFMNFYKILLISSTISSAILISSCATVKNNSSSNNNISQIKTQIAIEQIKEGNLNLAKSALDEAIEKNQSNANAYMFLAIVYQLDPTPTNRIKADEFYRKAISLEPKNSTIRNNYGQYLYTSNRFEDAITQFTVSSSDIAYSGRSIAFSNLGYSYYNTGKYKKALSSFENSLNLNSKNTDALLGAAMSFYVLKNIDRAESTFNEYRELMDLSDMSAKGLWFGMILSSHFDNLVELGRMAEILKTKYPDSPQYKKYLDQISKKIKLNDV